MLKFCWLCLLLIGTARAASNYEVEAKKFIDQASARYYKLYDQIAAETYTSIDDEDFEQMFKKLTTVKKIASELVDISKEASEFDLSKIHDAEHKHALHNLRKVGSLFVLGEDFFSSVLINLAALKELSTDKDIEPYLGGANMPNQDDSPIAYYPDIQRIVRRSKDADELKHYWEAWREKNFLWSSVNFYTIVEAFQNAAKILEMPVLELWYEYDKNKDFLLEMEQVMAELKPGYQQLHAFVRNELLKKYGDDIVNGNAPIPDHLFEQVLEQAWSEDSVIETYFPYKELPPYDGFVKHMSAPLLLNEAERFYMSLGFDGLSAEFRRHQLKEHDETTNSGDCRAAIFDLTPHVYMKYCQKVDFRKLMQDHGYLARIYYASQKQHLPSYYFNAYALEHPVGEAIILSASSPRYLTSIGLAKDFKFTDNVLTNRLFRMGIHTLLNIPLFFVHTKVMHDLLAGTVDMDSVNKHYWRLMEQYVGVEPPSDRSENTIDFPYKFYLDIDQNYQTQKFVSDVLGYQFYRALCNKTGQAGPLHNCDFYGNLSVGNDLKSMMSLGSSKSWRDVIAKVLPNNEKLSAVALLEYYQPIFTWLQAQNNKTKVKIGWNATKRKIV